MYIYIYICISVYYTYLYLYVCMYVSIYIYIYIYIAIVCDHEITHTSYVIYRDKIYIKLYGLFLWMGCNCLKTRQSHYEKTVYFLPEIPGTH